MNLTKYLDKYTKVEGIEAGFFQIISDNKLRKHHKVILIIFIYILHKSDHFFSPLPGKCRPGRPPMSPISETATVYIDFSLKWSVERPSLKAA